MIPITRSFIVIALCLTSQTSAAFTLIGLKGWASTDIQFHVNPQNCPDNLGDLLGEALDIWNAVPTLSVNLSSGSDSAMTIEQVLAGTIDVTPSVHCLTDPAAVNMDPAYIPGAAMGYKMDDAGQITAGALALNVQEGSAANIASIDRKILVSILVHEIGHVLGLGHSADKNAVMYYNAAEKKFASLAQDDVDGMTYLYARNEFGEDPVFGGCAVIGAPQNHPNSWWSILILLLPVFAVRLRPRMVRKAVRSSPR